MLLRNYDCIMEAHMLATAKSTSTVSAVDTSKNIKTQATNGTISDPYLGGSNSAFPIMAFSEKTICIGNGTHPVSYEDYRLAGGMIGGTFTKVSNDLVFDTDSNSWVRTLVVKYTNNTDTDFVVSEWGIWRAAGYTSSGTPPTSDSYEYKNSGAYECLVWRELLPTPVTIVANSTATLTFTLTVPHEVNAF